MQSKIKTQEYNNFGKGKVPYYLLTEDHSPTRSGGSVSLLSESLKLHL